MPGVNIFRVPDVRPGIGYRAPGAASQRHVSQRHVLTGRPRKALSLEGGRMVSDHLGRPESTWAGRLGQLDAHERQRLLGHIFRQLDGLPSGLSQIPAVASRS